MNNKEFTAILQIALWSFEGMSELEIRQHLAKLTSNEIIKAGINLCNYLKSIKLKGS